ncbi:glycosyltransferase family 28 domain-containing protein [Dactylonectria estremocensis]|uniref:Glycosyltransferase family 28 domain-containing protein n=1 Tax=Dactylonectria estremocensis TaxID=1079267 RepID=A0A9P9E632_9HYPO|nr:glycosyltransferase family 28 domain-containing protein [Dactylonectria estremocensis]
MALALTKSNGLGNVTFGDGDTKNHTSGDVGDDGRVNVQFHDSPSSLEAWCRKAQGSLAVTPERPRPRRFSSVILPEPPKPASGPRLNIAIHIVGSRGDVQPFIPIAKLLSSPPYGHRVRICTHPVFKDFVESQGIEFFSIGGDPEALMAYMVKNPGLLPNRESVKAGDIGKRRKEMWDIIYGCWRSCIEAGNGMGERVTASKVASASDLFIADAILANPPSMAHIHCAEKLNIPLHMVFTMPWSPTEKFSHPLAAMTYGQADAAIANYLSFMMMELLTWQGLGDLINKFRTQILHLDPISPMWGYQLLPRLRVPYSYLWSQSLIPKPSDWGPHINVTGFSFLSLANSYTPPPDLVQFLEKGPPPIYIGFGSIVVDDPQALTRLIFEAVELSGVRAIISKGWGSVGGGDVVPDDVYLIGNCPHDWLFQRVSAVVHHGGAGTTAAGIAAGRPTVVVPFFGDQPFWGQMIARAGGGPTPVPFKEMTADSLADSIILALEPKVQLAVQEMADRIAVEDGAGETVVGFQEHLNLDVFNCDICPDRRAMWRHKPTGAHLSGFALACLITERLIELSDVKLLRHKHWYVDEGAEHPIIGVVAAASNFMTTLGTAGITYSSRLRDRPRSKSSKAAKPTPQPSTETPTDVDQTTITANTDVDQETITGSTDPTQARDDGSKDVGTTKEPPKCDDNVHILTPTDMENLAHKMVHKSFRPGETVAERLRRSPTLHEKRKASWKAQEQGRHGKAFYVARATGRFTADVAKAGLKAPVALFYNVANGFHNFPSYTMNATEVRRRDEITGLGSGVRAAGKEFFYGFYDAFSGVVVKPYKGAKDEGARGFGKGVWNGGIGFFYNIGASIFGLPGYTLKGIEKECSRRHLGKLKAEILLIRLRQGIDDFRKATPAEKEEVVQRWKSRRPA